VSVIRITEQNIRAVYYCKHKAFAIERRKPNYGRFQLTVEPHPRGSRTQPPLITITQVPDVNDPYASSGQRKGDTKSEILNGSHNELVC